MFGTFAEQRHFEYPARGTYRGVVINANMAAHAPAGLAAFLLEKTAGMQYIVDPLTHAFQHEPEVICREDGSPKPAIKSLAEFYGDPIAQHIGQRPVLPKHFDQADVLASFTKNCVNFQRDHLKSYMEANDVSKYLEDDACSPPYALVSPYFYMTETTYEQWVEVMSRAAHVAREHLGDEAKIFTSVVVSQGILVSEQARRHIADTLNACQLNGYTFWADNLDEQSASRLELEGLLDLSHKLRAGGTREVINLHGGYFSVLASGNVGAGKYFTGVTHGPEFGEFRGVVPVGGGIPIARYYVPRLHVRMRYRDAQRIFNALDWLSDAASFHDNVCACAECKSVIDGNIENFTLFGDGNVKSVRRKHGIVRIEFPTGDTKKRCLKHYLQRKRLEYQASGELDRDRLLQELLASATQFEEVAGLDLVSHLRLWHKIFAD